MLDAVDRMPGRSKAPPTTEFSPEVQVLAVVADRLGELINAVVVNHPSGKGRATRVSPYPRPVTAIDRVRARRAKEDADDMASKLWPQGG